MIRRASALKSPEFKSRQTHKTHVIGVKASVATPVKLCAGTQSSPNRGNLLDRIIADGGYHGHNPVRNTSSPCTYRRPEAKGSISKLNVSFKRPAVIEPVIRPLKDNHRMGRNYLAYSSGDVMNVMLATVGYITSAASFNGWALMLRT